MPTSAASVPASEQVRRTFIEFFRVRPAPNDGHTVVPSSPCVPHDDPTLLFTNAGMNQFKPIFLGRVDPSSPLSKLKRAVNSQKCIRAGGKHNDLEDVGKDTYHHTFFEMLGNWSFGDYFKAEAIAWSWELLTEVYGIPPDRLYATYFRGEPDLGLEPDFETRDLWLRFLPPGRVLPGGMTDNFWEMGDTGPCGPCTEIHYDRIGGRDAARLVNAGSPDVIEVWNNVFIQFNREENGKLRTLPARHVDTGMGLERLLAIVQSLATGQMHSNYDTDLFTPIFEAIQRHTGAPPYRGRVGEADDGRVDTAYRVVADHIRCLTFAITDGAVPGNEGRGYVLRRILRRAARLARQALNAGPGLLASLVPTVVAKMGEAFPELRADPARVQALIREEEESFARTLDRGIRMFEDAAAATAGTISAAEAFTLYDTYGFPIDLTCQMAQERGLSVDVEGFHRLMDEQRRRSRAAARNQQQTLTLGPEHVARLRHMGIELTDDNDKFHGRDVRATVRAIFNGENFDEHARADRGGLTPVALVLDRTNFYAEMGGQVADTGRLVVPGGMGGASGEGPDIRATGEFRVENVQAAGGYVLHIGHAVRGEVRVGDIVVCRIDHTRRQPIMAHHTTTHLLNFALRRILGAHVEQKGSLVAPDRLRFDFSHSGPAGVDALARVEQLVRDAITSDLPVYADLAPLPTARRIAGIRAVFGEAYPDPVRVVAIGVPVRDLLAQPDNPAWLDYSVELCGGTHLARTGQAGAFAILAEEAVARGVRRVVAVAGVPAEAAIQASDQAAARLAAAEILPDEALSRELADLARLLDTIPMPLTARESLKKRLAALQERAKSATRRQITARRQHVLARARQIAQDALDRGEEVIVTELDAGQDRQTLEQALAAIRAACPRAAVMLLSPDGSDPASPKVAVVASVPPSLVQRGLDASEWVRRTAQMLGGRGGGRAEAAHGGGVHIEKLPEALAAARAFALDRLMST